ncbi:hypothetical protein Taro_002674 [Colocasia esculenta]|uniref:Uncharacterized protein n=1 Tax=Colocasia esculenta TaxID=4460 RepID=A0A843THS6_COLES|nr:hypothetical protein [Colocasia esculenta]
MTSGRSSRPRHRKVLYFPHRRLWTMEYSCKVWCKPWRRRLIPRQHSRLSWRLRLVAFDHRTLDEALSAACRQEGEMEQYLEEKKASQKRPAATFQRQDKKKAVYQTPQRSVAVGSSQDYDAILGLDWLEEHYVLVYCRQKRIVFRIPGEDEFSHPLPRNLAGKLVISAMKAMRMVNKGCDAFLASVLDPATCCIKELAGSSRKASPTPDCAGACSRTRRKAILEAGVVGDETLVEETLETDSERRD